MENSLQIKLVAINARYTHSCLALFCIRHELEKYLPQHPVILYQFSINESYHEMVLQLTAGTPDAIFISAAIWNSEIVIKLIADLKRCLPDCQIVVGGPQAEIVFNVCNGLCSVVYGEIEGIDPVFYSDLEAQKLKNQYRGTFQAIKDKGIPIVYKDSDFDEYLQNRHIYYESSRGCPFSCSYCLSAVEVGVYHKDLEQVKAELKQILSHQPKVLRFIDRTYNDNWRRALDIWQYLMEQDCETLFHFEIAPDFFTEEMFKFLETVPAGRFQFEIGVQSTTTKTLDTIRRKIDPSRVHDIVSRLAVMNTIHLHVDLILGLPFETEETFLRSFDDVFAMGAHYIQMGLLKMLPNTPIYLDADKYEYSFSSAPPYAVFHNQWLNHQKFTELYWFCECVEKFMNNRFFVSLWQYLRKRGETISEVFVEILQWSREENLFGLAATQELMCTILMHWAASRADIEVICELLQYDWLRCGHRMFPEELQLIDGAETFMATRDRLYQVLPGELEGVYDPRERNRFFKRGLFWKCSPELLKALGDSSISTYGCLCVVTEREDSLYKYNKIIFL